MILDEKTRGRLEQIIDNSIQSTPNIVKLLFNQQVRKRWSIENQNDFSLGFALGTIQNEFWTQFYNEYGRKPYQEELLEISDIIFKRVPEICNAIFNAG